MDFINHTFSWVKGEIFEATLIFFFSLIVFISGFMFWKLGSTPNAKALFIPLLVVGAIFTSSGVSMYFSNQKRLVEYEKSYQTDAQAFIQQEKERIEGFMYMYTMTKIIATAFFFVAILFFWFSKSHNFHAIAIALILFGLSALVIDYFSTERANIYYEQIEKELN